MTSERNVLIKNVKVCHLELDKRLWQPESSARYGASCFRKHSLTLATGGGEAIHNLHWRNCSLVLGSGFEVRYLRWTTADTWVLMSYSSRKWKSCEYISAQAVRRTWEVCHPSLGFRGKKGLALRNLDHIQWARQNLLKKIPDWLGFHLKYRQQQPEKLAIETPANCTSV
jgi:hypothetical protein